MRFNQGRNKFHMVNRTPREGLLEDTLELSRSLQVRSYLVIAEDYNGDVLFKIGLTPRSLEKKSLAKQRVVSMTDAVLAWMDVPELTSKLVPRLFGMGLLLGWALATLTYNLNW